MPCKTIMMKEFVTLGDHESVATAISYMRRFGMRNVPIVDADDKFLGVFSLVNLIKMLLPAVATIEGGLDDLSFVHASIEDIRSSLVEVESLMVRDNIDTENIPVAHPDTSVMEAMLLLYQHRTHVTVVDEVSKKVVGVVTVDSLLKKIEKVP